MITNSSKKFEEHLWEDIFADIITLGERDYPEIGVPTFLIGEDSYTRANSYCAMSATRDQLACHLAAMAKVFSAARSLLTLHEVNQLLELLADRHFLGCGSPPFSKIAALHPQPH